LLPALLSESSTVATAKRFRSTLRILCGVEQREAR
jgi:hypothetical protein